MTLMACHAKSHTARSSSNAPGGNGSGSGEASAGAGAATWMGGVGGGGGSVPGASPGMPARLPRCLLRAGKMTVLDFRPCRKDEVQLA